MAKNIYTPSPSKIFFIDPVFLKQNTSLNENVDDKLCVEAIQSAQDMFILPILGNGLYKQLEFEISGGTLSGDHLYLVTEFIQPCLAASTMLHLLPFISYQFKNKGVEKQKSDFSESASRADVEWLIEKYREKAAFYAQRTTNFLVANTDIYINYLNPQLGTNGNGADLYYPQRSAYNCGIFLSNVTSNSSINEFSGWGLSLTQFAELKGLI